MTACEPLCGDRSSHFPRQAPVGRTLGDAAGVACGGNWIFAGQGRIKADNRHRGYSGEGELGCRLWARSSDAKRRDCSLELFAPPVVVIRRHPPLSCKNAVPSDRARDGVCFALASTNDKGGEHECPPPWRCS